MNIRKRKEITKNSSNKSYKRRKRQSLSITDTSESDSTCTSSSDIVVDKSEFLPNIPENYRAFVELLYQVRCESKDLINHITPIVLCCQYQNPIRCAYRLLHKNLEEIAFLSTDAVHKKVATAQIRKVASNLTDNVVTLVRILDAVKTIQEKLYRINRPLQKFELYVTHMKQILKFVVRDLLNRKLTISSIDTPSPFSFRRLECRCCKQYVTFIGCDCTKWIYDKVPSQIIQNQLLSPAEDGPMPSNKRYMSDWYNLQDHVYRITTLKPNSKRNKRRKDPTLNISRTQSNLTTRCPCLANNSLDLSKHVLTSSPSEILLQNK